MHDGQRRCSQCGIGYCGKECATKAWKKYHKKLCTPIEKWLQFYEKNTAAILGNTSIGQAIMSPQFDYDFAHLTVDRSHRFDDLCKRVINGSTTYPAMALGLGVPAAHVRLMCLACVPTSKGIIFTILKDHTRLSKEACAKAFCGALYQDMVRMNTNSPKCFSQQSPAEVHETSILSGGRNVFNHNGLPLDEIPSLSDLDDGRSPCVYRISLTLNPVKDSDMSYQKKKEQVIGNSTMIKYEHDCKTANNPPVQHHFLVVCMSKKMRIVQSYHPYYDPRDWMITALPLSEPAVPLPVPKVDNRYPIFPNPKLRGIHDRDVGLGMVTDVLTTLADRRKSNVVRGNAFRDLTGIDVPSGVRPYRSVYSKLNLSECW
eukprot:TRINITY_DN2704_c0_g1_i1.p1 TRINITY_DN2704_c0_g1~~TRINITY_DN2704_c0_g1_i1.p1  ORF type:complete len:373 (-),score=27.41 TRINITY_DN2704_c0_g1_i1:80-1198(-)